MYYLLRDPVILLFSCIVAVLGFIQSANSRGESGHFRLVPLWTVKCCEIRLLVMTCLYV